jgi:hypothetical protein
MNQRLKSGPIRSHTKKEKIFKERRRIKAKGNKTVLYRPASERSDSVNRVNQ